MHSEIHLCNTLFVYLVLTHSTLKSVKHADLLHACPLKLSRAEPG